MSESERIAFAYRASGRAVSDSDHRLSGGMQLVSGREESGPNVSSSLSTTEVRQKFSGLSGMVIYFYYSSPKR